MVFTNIAKLVVRTMSTFRLGLIQLEVNEVKVNNIERAVSYISSAKKQNADIIALPECFNSPYGIATYSSSSTSFEHQLAQAASGCAPSVEVNRYSMLSKQSAEPLGWVVNQYPTLANSYNNKRLGMVLINQKGDRIGLLHFIKSYVLKYPLKSKAYGLLQYLKMHYTL
ncbi:hypothetical protein E2986_12323 [Frieseomelitta varia]|uniref:CN hydrolase domain-containing protein n=1 Tax=Frieseomelitta varia TaxID=561572 RepID=A0A833RYH4_9HYME|nr:hypothetical protein E2986_12323 [Frieseomelitta varia]